MNSDARHALLIPETSRQAGGVLAAAAHAGAIAIVVWNRNKPDDDDSGDALFARAEDKISHVDSAVAKSEALNS
jgi:hypothetical protein